MVEDTLHVHLVNVVNKQYSAMKQQKGLSPEPMNKQEALYIKELNITPEALMPEEDKTK